MFDLEEHERFALRQRGEIVALLERLRAERTLMSMEYGDGHAIVSRVLEVRRDADALVIDIARDPDVNEALFLAPRLFFMTELDHVQIAFESTRAAPIAMGDGPAAAISMPGSIVRLQRREWYRVQLPSNEHLLCTVLDRHGNASPAHAVDLSCGGVGIVIDEHALHGGIGDGLELILSLPDVGRVELDATLSNILPAGPPEPGEPVQVRLGFRFDGLSTRTETQIQRYVTRLEVGGRRS